MKTAVVYCRVSTDKQEQEGTSLQTQMEGCLKHCQENGHDAAHSLSETYSGLTLERPKLNELRELVRAEAIDVVVCYSLDRLSRDPVHGVIITQELEKHGVKLEAVTEDVDSTELGKLISYVRGYASKWRSRRYVNAPCGGRGLARWPGRYPMVDLPSSSAMTMTGSPRGALSMSKRHAG